MKYSILFGILLAAITTAVAQRGSVRLLPEAGQSYPLGDFKSQNVFAAKGYQLGGHLDLMWGSFGLGLYGGVDRSDIQYEDLLPAGNPGLSIVKMADIDRGHWQQLAAGLGPVWRLELSKRINFELSSKVGIAQFAYPDYSQLVNIGAPPSQEFTLYQTENEALARRFNPMLLSAGRLNIGLTRNIDLSLAGNFRHVRDVHHAYRYLDGNFSPDMSNEALIDALGTAPTVAEVRKCHFNSVGVTVGLGITFGGNKDKPGDEVKIAPPVPEYPDDGATLSAEEADSLVLQWQRETPETGKANYNVWLYKAAESGQGADSLIFKTKTQRKNELALPENIQLEPDQTYKWRVQAVDDKELKACPEGCYSVEATFKVVAGQAMQYYHLSNRNSGNYIEVRNAVQVILPENFATGGNINGRIINQQNEEVFKAENLISGGRGEGYTVDDNGRLTVNLSRFESGYYVFELENDRKRQYFFRFKIVKSNEPKKD